MDSSRPTRSELLATVPDILEGPVVLLDPDGAIVYLNPAAERILEWTREEAVGRPVWDTLFPAHASAEIRDLFERVIRGRETEPMELEMAVRSGGTRRIMWSYRVVTGPDGSVRGLLATGSDVTRLRELEDRDRRLHLEEQERLAQEDALRDSEARFSGIVELASDAIISIDTHHRILLFNRGAEAIFGWDEDEVLGRPLDILLPPSAREVHRTHVEHFERSPVSSRTMGQRQEISGLRKNGEEFPAEASILKLDLAGERIFAVVLRDVSQRVAREVRQQVLARAGRVLSSSLDLVESLEAVAACAVEDWADFCLVDRVRPDGTIERVAARHHDPGRGDLEDAFLAVALDRSRPHLMSEVLETGRPHFEPEVDSEHLAAVAQGPEHERLLGNLGLASYLVVPVSVRGRTLGALLFGRTEPRHPFDDADRLLGSELGARAGLAIENALLYRDVQEALLARDDVLGVVSHDLGNPLQAIFIGLEALERERSRRGDDRPGQEEYYLSAIRRSAEVMERLIHDLLEIRRIEAGHLTLEREDHAVGPLVREALAVLDPLARVKSVKIENRLDGSELPSLSVDGDRIQQVLSNLIGNAVKHSPENGRVELTGSVDGEVVRIEVRDEGPGIPAAERGQVFQRFWRGAGGRGSGIGLGLSIARGIVDAHGGRIWVDSSPGSGSTFAFTLPIGRPDPDLDEPFGPGAQGERPG